jgi:hypothetical protein
MAEYRDSVLTNVKGEVQPIGNVERNKIVGLRSYGM